MTLFEQGHFTLHSGGKSWFKINCDSLSDDDIDFLAEYIITYIKPYLEEFDYVYGIPSGGVRLAASLNNKLNLAFNQDSELERILIADDVYTTGQSFILEKNIIEKAGNIVVGGVVIFARRQCWAWVYPILKFTIPYYSDTAICDFCGRPTLIDYVCGKIRRY